MPSTRPLLIIAALTAAASSITLNSNRASATMPPIAESQQDLQHRLDELGKHFHGRALARWSNPDDQKALKGLWDASILGLPPYSTNDVSALVNMLKAQASVLQAYTTAGHAVPGSPKEAMVRTKYQDEIVRASAFLTQTSAALLQAIGDLAEKVKPEQITLDRRKGIDEGRNGIRSLLESFTTQLPLPEVTPENKMLLLDALAANAQTIAAYSPQDDRQRYARASSAVLDKLNGPEKAKLEAFIAAMGTSDCKGLCTLKG